MTLSKEKLASLRDLYQEHKFEEVIQQGNALLEEFSTDIKLMKILASSNIRLARLDVAIEHYKKAINFSPMDAELYNNMGVAYKKKGDTFGAAENYQKAIDLNKDYLEAYINLGSVLQEKGNHKAAIDVYQRTIKISAEDPRLHNNLGSAYNYLNNLSAAKESYLRAVELNSDYAEAHSNLGSLLLKEGYVDKAIDSIRRALHIQPNNPTFHFNMGTAQAEKNYGNEAIESYQRAIELKSDVYTWYYSLGIQLMETGDTEGALKNLKRSLEMNPSFSKAYFPIGLIYYKLKRYVDALTAFEKAGDEKSFVQSLLCLHSLNRHNEFTEKISSTLDKYKNNIEVAAICAFVCDQTDEENLHFFCKNPLDFIYFSSLNHHEKNPQKFNDELLNKLKQEPTTWAPRNKATRNGFHTTRNLFGKSCGVVSDLEKIIKKELELYYNKFKSNKCGFIDFWPETISLYGWSIRIHKDGFQTPHIHPGGWLSGVIYLQLVDSENKDEGAIEFSLCGTDYTVINNNFPKVRYHPTVGDIVLFPSSLFHYTIPIRNEGERVIVSFDLLPSKRINTH